MEALVDINKIAIFIAVNYFSFFTKNIMNYTVVNSIF